MTRKQFLYNPKNPKKSFDVYIDKNPKDTIQIKYSTVQDVENTIKKLEQLYKTDKYPINEYGKLDDYESAFRSNVQTQETIQKC